MNSNIPYNPNKFPANLLKFDAYREVVDSLETAVDIVKKKRLAYGQPCVIAYKPKLGTIGVSNCILFAIGTMDPKNPYLLEVYYNSKGELIDAQSVYTELIAALEEIERLDIKGINNKIDTLFSDVSTLDNRINKTDRRLRNTVADVSVLKIGFSTIENRQNAVDASMAAISVEFAQVKKDVSTMMNSCVKRDDLDDSFFIDEDKKVHLAWNEYN